MLSDDVSMKEMSRMDNVWPIATLKLEEQGSKVKVVYKRLW